MLIWVNQCGETKGEQRTGKLTILQNNFQPCPELTLPLHLLLCAWRKAGTTPQILPSLLHPSLQLWGHLCQSYTSLHSPWAAPAACFPLKHGEELVPSCSPRDGHVLIFWLWLPITVGVSQGKTYPCHHPCLLRNKIQTVFLRPLSEYDVFLTAGSGWKMIVATAISRSWRYSALL